MSSIIELMPSDPNSEQATTPPAKRKASAAVLPPNDPQRKDWGVLSDSLGLKERFAPPAGCSPDEGARLMMDLLLKVVQDDSAYEALIMKCAGETIAGKMRDDVGGRASFEEMISFLKSRLWNRRLDGTKTVSRLGREHSSNDVIQAWEPAAGGIVKYLQVNVSNILNRDWKRVVMQINNPYKTSVEVLESKGRYIANNGQIFDSTAQNASDDAPDYVEDSDALDKALGNGPRTPESIDDERDEGELATQGEEYSEGDADEHDEEALVTEQRSLFEACRLPSTSAKRGSPILMTTEHPDFMLLAAAAVEELAEPGLDQEERVEQLRELATKVVNLHYDEHADRTDVLEAVESWDPTEYTFANYFPEVCDEIAKSLDGVGRKDVKMPEQMQLFAVDLVAVGDELVRQAKRIPARPAGWSAEEWVEAQEDIENWFGARVKDQDDLLSPERPDYLALCTLTGRRPKRDISPEEMAKSLKDLYQEWSWGAYAAAREFGSDSVRVLSDNHAAVMQMNERMQSWDPLTHGYAGEVMIGHLNEIRIQQEEAEQAQRSQEAEALRKEYSSVEKMHKIRRPRPVPIPRHETMSLFADESVASPALSTPVPPSTPNTEPSL